MKLLLRKISFGYAAEHFVLKDIHLAIESQESVAIVGPSGSGKTTLLRIAAGLLQEKLPTGAHFSGSVHYGDSLQLTALRQARQIGYMFQSPILFPFMNVQANVAIGLEGISTERAKATVDSLLEKMGLAARATAYPPSLSGGMQTRVALARTFSSSPALLLMDEPFGALDIAWRISLYNELLLMRRNSPATTVLVTHDLDEAFVLANRIIVLGSNGGILEEVRVPQGPPAPLDLEQLQLFLGEQRHAIGRIHDLINRDVVAARKLN